MPDLGRVSQIDASAFDAGSAYIAVKKPLLDDLRPYIFRTHDYGRTWARIVNGLGPTDYVHVVREDRYQPGSAVRGDSARRLYVCTTMEIAGSRCR